MALALVKLRLLKHQGQEILGCRFSLLIRIFWEYFLMDLVRYLLFIHKNCKMRGCIFSKYRFLQYIVQCTCLTKLFEISLKI